jgi:hypothetical protein
MKSAIALSALLAIAACANALHSQDASADSIRIGLSKDAAKKARLDEHVQLFKSIAAGNSHARENWDELKPEEQNNALAAIAWSKDDARTREQAIRKLARLSPSSDPNSNGVTALASVAVAEGDGSLRALARKALTARDDKRAASLLVSALNFDDALIKSNTIEALNEIGGPRVFEVIIEHWKEIWGASPRDHVFIGTQRSYIADYDISGNSYDPVVKTFMTGVVLDTKIVKVEGDVYYVWMRELTGERKLPNDPAAWQRWVKKEEPRLVKLAEKKKAEAVDYFDKLKE